MTDGADVRLWLITIGGTAVAGAGAGGLFGMPWPAAAVLAFAGLILIGAGVWTGRTGTTVLLLEDEVPDTEPADAGAHDPAGPARAAVESLGAKILIVEDNPLNQKITAAMLASQGYRFEIAENGAVALDEVETGAYGLVLMDIQMPVMDGLEATRQIRAMPPPFADMPIVAVTANTLRGDKETYLAAGLNDVVTKPVDPTLLIGMVRDYFGPSELMIKAMADAQADEADDPAPGACGQTGEAPPLAQRSRAAGQTFLPDR